MFPTLDEGETLFDAHPAAPAVAPQLTLEPGSDFGQRYRIESLIGEGGMGRVYKAYDKEVGRYVALKLLRPMLAGDPSATQRFRQELLLASKVSHKNILRVHDLGEVNGIKFISMTYVEGEDLHRVLQKEGRLPVDRVVKIARQLCAALEAAHIEGVVHRDLKPNNVLLDKGETAYVSDFGLAKSVEAGAMGMTRTGEFLGTPRYMSPEQAEGKPVDHRSDLYSFGLILYEMAAGNVPFTGDSALQVMFQRLKQKPKSPKLLRPDLPDYLVRIILRCLEKDPRQRYRSAQEILADLEAARAPSLSRGIPIALPALEPLAPYWKWVASGVAVLLLALTTVVFRGKIFSRPAKPAAAPQSVSLAILPFRNASGDTSLDWLGPNLAEILRTELGLSAYFRTVSSDRMHQILRDLRLSADAELDPETLRRIAEFTGADRVVRGQYVKIADHIRVDATLHDLKRQRVFPLKAEASSEKDLLRAMDELARSIQQNVASSADVLKELQAKSFRPWSSSVQALRYYNEGLQLLRQGNTLEAAKRFEGAAKEDPEFALTYAKLGQAYASLGHDSEAERFSRRAVELSEKLSPQERYLVLAGRARILHDNKKAIESYENLVKVSPNDAAVRFELAQLYEGMGSLHLARNHYAKVLEGDPKYANALLAMGRVEVKRGNPQEGLEYFNRALTLAVQFENDQEKADILHALGIAYSLLNKPHDALRYYQESLAIRRRLGLKSGIAASVQEIGKIQNSLGKPDAALASYKEALQLEREIANKAGIGSTLINLGTYYHDRGLHDEALKPYKEALQIERELGNESAEALCLNNIGTIHLDKGQNDDALTYFERALQLREKSKVPRDIAQTLHNLAATQANMGQYEQALTQSLRALELSRGAGDRRGAAIESYSLGTLFEEQGRYGAAVHAKEEALKTYRELQNRGLWLAEILGGYGNALALVGQGEEAQKTLEEALNLARQLKNEVLVAQTLNFQGNSFFYRGDFKAARSLYEQALQVASRTSDRRLILAAKANLAEVTVRQGRPQGAIGTLKGLVRQADALGLKYLSAECSIHLGEALLNAKDYSQARQELESGLRKSEKLGARALLARSHYLLATALRLRGNQTDATGHLGEARRIVEEMCKEARTDAVSKRADLSPILSQPSR